MTRHCVNEKRKTAFSLIELSIVILIISILITGSLSASISAINAAKNKSTREKMDQIYQALGNYLLINGHLPCPASLLKIKSSDSDYGDSVGSAGACSGTGVYSSAAASNLVYGMIPVQTLGLENEMGEDAFGSKFSYVVDKNYTGSSFATAGATTYVSGVDMTGSIITLNSVEGSVTYSGSDDMIFAIISHGANKSGAFPANAATQNARSSDASEMDNDLDSISSPNYNATIVQYARSSEVFDDIVFARSRNQFVAEFEAYSAVKCPGAVGGILPLNYGTLANYNFAEASYNQVVISSDPCPAGYQSTTQNPTRRCGAFGIWQDYATNPCTE